MYKLDLFKIWENQSISDTLKDTLNVMMRSVEYFIKDKAPGSLYSEWAKREDCWLTVKEAFKDWEIPVDPNDLIQPNGKVRKRISESDISSSFYQEVEQTVKSLGPGKWKEIYLYCKENPDIPESYTIAAHKVGKKLMENVRPAPREIILANELLNKIIFKTAIFDEVKSDENF